MSSVKVITPYQININNRDEHLDVGKQLEKKKYNISDFANFGILEPHEDPGLVGNKFLVWSENEQQ